jgi:hypothetical protein
MLSKVAKFEIDDNIKNTAFKDIPSGIWFEQFVTHAFRK